MPQLAPSPYQSCSSSWRWPAHSAPRPADAPRFWNHLWLQSEWCCIAKISAPYELLSHQADSWTHLDTCCRNLRWHWESNCHKPALWCASHSCPLYLYQKTHQNYLGIMTYASFCQRWDPSRKRWWFTHRMANRLQHLRQGSCSILF